MPNSDGVFDASAVGDLAAPPPAPRVPDNGLDAAVAGVVHQKSAAINNNVMQAAATSPDQTADFKHLASFVGVPLDTVRAQPEAIRQRAAVQTLDAGNLTSQFPHVAQFLTDPTNASIAHDDVPTLKGIEQSLTQWNPSVGERVRQWFDEAFRLPERERARAANAYAAMQSGMTPGEARNAVGGMSEVLTQGAANAVSSASLGIIPNVEGDPTTGTGAVGAGAGNLLGFVMGGPVKAGNYAVEKLGVSALERRAGDSFAKALAKDVTKGAMTLGTATTLAGIGQTINTPDIQAAGVKAGSDFASGAATGGIFGALGRMFPENTLIQNITRIIGTNVAIDASQGKTPFEDAANWEKLSETQRANAVFNYGLNTLFSLHGSGRAEGGWWKDAAKADVAQQDAKVIDSISQLSAASKLRGRDLQGFHDFMVNATEDTPAANLYVDATTFAGAMQQSGVTLPDLAKRMPEVAAQIEEAVARQGDLRIPTADYATHIAGGSLDQAILPHLKTDPEGMTFNQSQEHLAAQVETLKAQAEKIVQDTQYHNGWNESAANVEKELLTQLNTANRFSPDVNKTYAKLAAAMNSNLAARGGRMPEEQYVKYPLDITSLIGKENFKALDQPASPPEEGPFGQVFTDYTHDAPGAIVKLTEMKSGEAIGALHHPDIGDIDLPWGVEGQNEHDGYGLAKLLRWHPEVVSDLQAILESMQVTKRTDNRVQLESENHKGAVRLQWDGVTKHWLLTAFEKGEKGNDASPRTDTTSGNEGGDSLPLAPEDIVDQKLNDFYQDNRGQISFGNDITKTPSVISLLAHADLSTFVHELGHFNLQVLAHMATEADAAPEVRRDMGTLLHWFNVPDLDTWNKMSLDEQRPHHEQFARGFEAYLFEGKSPSLEMQGIFSRVRAWLIHVYKSLTALNVPLTDEVRGVMDRLVASEDQIREAQQARGMAAMFVQKPEGMDDAAWAEYQRTDRDATEEALALQQSKSLRDMKWLSNARSEVMRDLQRQANAQRKIIRAEAEQAIANEPIYRAEQWLRKGTMTDADGNAVELAPEARAGAKLSRAAVDSLFPPGDLARPDLTRLKGLVSDTGLHPDLAAEMFGFGSGRDLVNALLNATPRKEAVKGLTDTLMLERHGEMSEPDAIARTADAAVHNELRARVIATEWKTLGKIKGPVAALAAAAKEAAEATINGRQVRDVKPYEYEAAEARASKAADKAASKDDPVAAAEAKRAQLLNNRLAKSAIAALDDVKKAVDYFKRFDRDSIRSKMEPDDRAVIDGLLERFDFRQNPPQMFGGQTISAKQHKQQVQLADWVNSQKALGYSPLEVADLMDPSVRMHYKDMTIEQVRGLFDTVRMVEKIARERQTVTVDGQRHELKEAIAPMLGKMVERGEKFTDAQIAERPRYGVDPVWRVTLDRVQSLLRAGMSEMLRPDYKGNKYDLHEVLGPFQKAFTERLFKAGYDYGDTMDSIAKLKKERVAEYGLDRAWQDTLNTVVANHTLMDNSLAVPTLRRLIKRDLIGIAMHVGNESNFDKLTKGMGWEPTAVWQALHDNMTLKDWNAARLMGELAGAKWDDMAAMNKRLGNDTPDKIEPRPFPTKFGDMPGWYAPIDYDPIRSKLGKKKADAQAVNPADGLFGRDYYRADTTTNGSLNARADYSDILDLDFNRIEKRISDSARDLAYREALIDVHKIYANTEFRNQFQRTYGPEEYKHLGDWLGRLVNADVGDERQSKFTAIMATSRRAMVANGVALRISTMLKHGGSAGAKSTGYFIGGGEKFFAARAASMATNYTAEVAEALAKVPEIRQRYRQQDRDLGRAQTNIFDPESIHGKAERFGHAGVAWLDFLTAVPTANAAYDWAITTGVPKRLGGTGQPMTEADAAKFASKIVREAHGSTNEASQSLLVNNKSELVKTLTILHGFMNNAFGQNADTFDKLLHANGLGKPEIFARSFMAQIVPAIAAGWVTFGGPNDDESWAGWVFHHVAGEYAGMVPMVRDGFNAVVEGRDTAGAPPWIRALTDIYKAGAAVVKGEEAKHPIKDVGNATGLVIPGLGQVGSTAQFLYDEYTGKQSAESVSEWVRGVMTGHAKELHH